MAPTRRRPVRCRNCGYVTTPVSGFCPNCLERLPLGRRFAILPIVALAALLAVGATVVAASSTGSIARRPVSSEASSNASPTTVSPAVTTAPSTAVASVSASAVAQPAGSPAPSGPPSNGSASPGPSAAPTAVLGSQSAPSAPRASSGPGSLPSTSTSDDGVCTPWLQSQERIPEPRERD